MKKFLCTMDPIVATFVIVVVVLYGGLAIQQGIGKLLLLLLFGVIFFAVIATIGFLLYKAIVFAQSKCKENQ